MLLPRPDSNLGSQPLLLSVPFTSPNRHANRTLVRIKSTRVRPFVRSFILESASRTALPILAASEIPDRFRIERKLDACD